MIELGQALQAVAGRNEFVVKELSDTIAFDYLITKHDSFNDPNFGWIRRNFRGMTFCKHSKKLISLPFPKFFNINQTAESQYFLHSKKKAAIYEKADGSLIHFYRKYDGKLVASTCRSPESIQAVEALKFVLSNQILHDQIQQSISDGLTPLFEWCAPNNQIVLRYESNRLIYLMSRFRCNGTFLFENKFIDKVIKFDIKFSEIYNQINKNDFEGYVCYLEDGHVFKIKTPWYLERHRSVDLLMQPKYKIYELALKNAIDDILPTMPETHKTILLQIDDEVKTDFIEAKNKIETEFTELHNKLYDGKRLTDRKSFALAANQSENFSILMQIYSNKNPDESIKKKLLESYVQKYPNKTYGET